MMRRTRVPARGGDPAGQAHQHQCSVCGKVAPWGRSWQWYGSWEAMENGEPIVRTCSDWCRTRAKAEGLVPKNAKKAPVDG